MNEVMPLPQCVCGRVFHKPPGMYFSQRCVKCGVAGDFFVDDPECPIADCEAETIESCFGPEEESW